MAFWGVELKPRNPYKHRYDESRGRLHISQATLGFGQSTKKSVVQCNVSEKCPVLLCSLLPEKTESCSLNLEFEEEDEVVFSVIGPRSVHLTGFFLGPTGDLDNHYEEDSDSYGEDIAETETEPSSDYDSEDEYEDGFIDDDDLEIYPPSPRPNSGVRIEEIVDEETPRDGTGTNEHLKKKHRPSDSDVGDVSQQQIVVKNTVTPVLESEDEDGFPVSTTSKSKHILKDAGANRLDKKMNADEMKDKVEDNRSHSACLKRKIDVINQDGKMDRVSDPPSDSFVPSGGVAAQDGEKSKKKKKEKVKNKKHTEAEVENLPGEELNEKLSNDKEAMDSSIFSSTVDPQSTGKSKKKKKGKAKDKNLQPEGDPSAEAVDKACQDDDNKPTHVKEATIEAMVQDPPIKAEEANTKLPDDDVGRNGDPAVPDEHKEGKKKKRKKSKTHESDTNMIREEAKLEPEEVKRELFAKLDEQKTEARPSKPRTFSNGLVIEELSMGKPDGKRASPGNRVSVYYIGKLKKNGEIFDSNIGKRPFKFRLGIGQVIKGWDVGIAGMRVGDKRRLTIPPAMGYGSKGAGGKIPGNAWLVFDVELVDVQ